MLLLGTNFHELKLVKVIMTTGFPNPVSADPARVLTDGSDIESLGALLRSRPADIGSNPRQVQHPSSPEAGIPAAEDDHGALGGAFDHDHRERREEIVAG